MATKSALAPITATASLNTDKERKRYIRYDLPDDEESALSSIFVDRDAIGLERGAKAPKKIQITIKFVG